MPRTLYDSSRKVFQLWDEEIGIQLMATFSEDDMKSEVKRLVNWGHGNGLAMGKPDGTVLREDMLKEWAGE